MGAHEGVKVASDRAPTGVAELQALRFGPSIDSPEIAEVGRLTVWTNQPEARRRIARPRVQSPLEARDPLRPLTLLDGKNGVQPGYQGDKVGVVNWITDSGAIGTGAPPGRRSRKRATPLSASRGFLRAGKAAPSLHPVSAFRYLALFFGDRPRDVRALTSEPAGKSTESRDRHCSRQCRSGWPWRSAAPSGSG